MAISINSIELLQKYLNGVLERAEHHAVNVKGVSLALIGAVIAKSDGEIEVREYKGRPANILWFCVNEKKYAMTYNHQKEQIELRYRTQCGKTLGVFDNKTTYETIIEVFNNL
jgi:hypothetical protein